MYSAKVGAGGRAAAGCVVVAAAIRSPGVNPIRSSSTSAASTTAALGAPAVVAAVAAVVVVAVVVVVIGWCRRRQLRSGEASFRAGALGVVERAWSTISADAANPSAHRQPSTT
jgi:hypothetical protein